MNNIPLLDLKAQYRSISGQIDEAVKKVVESQSFVLGNEVEALEKEVAAYCRAGYGIGVASGTDALLLSLRGLGIGQGDEVITTPLTFMATAEAISNLGATPVLADIEPDTYNIDPSLIEEKITAKTKAILPVHIFGQCADMDPIMDLAEKKGLRIVEDCAQAIGADYKGRRAGSMGDAGCLSFFPSKNLGGFGDGGMVVTNDKELADRIKLLRVHGSRERYYHETIGYNSRLDAIQAAVLRVKLKYLDEWLKARRSIADFYTNELAQIGLITPDVPDYNVHTYHLYIITLPSRDKLLKRLESVGIGARVHYPVPLHLQKCYADLGHKRGDFPVSEKVSDQLIAIPLYPELSTEDRERVAGAVKEFQMKEQGLKAAA
jgi:dTDP-4-amino-4,6-dideoxygalactose transaminase